MATALDTPMMRQYRRFKEQFPDAVLFFRMGDFYEMFFEDAEIVSRELGLTLTSRSKTDNIPMAGVPYRAVDQYLFKLVSAGYKVAICDQVEDPAQAKGIVERDVTRVVTPGTITEEEGLERSRPNFLAALTPAKDRIGLAWVDLSTGKFLVTDLPPDRIVDELSRLSPAELIYSEELSGEALPEVWEAIELLRPGQRSPRAAWTFVGDNGQRELLRHFGTKSLAGFGVDDGLLAVRAAGALLIYLQETQRADLKHLNRIALFDAGEVMLLDRATQDCLELVRTLRDPDGKHTLSEVLDRCETAMGSRLLRQWITCPLRTRDGIEARQEGVTELFEDAGFRRSVREALHRVYDLERLISKFGTQRANCRDLLAVGHSLAPVPEIEGLLQGRTATALAEIEQDLDALPEIRELIETSIDEEAPIALKDGGLIRKGYHAELDELRALKTEGQGFIAKLQQQEIERTGISSLKIRFNRVFGYYLEVTNTHAHKVPDDYIRKQTLKNAGRYVTPELKEFEEKVLRAQEKTHELEFELFCEIRDRVAAEIPKLQRTAEALSRLDALASLSHVAAERGYVKPEIREDKVLEIEEGRHPVIEAVQGGEEFVPNDTELDGDGQSLMILTGPNMAGKSTYIRQVALLTLMAQMGSYVPARAARIGLVDRIFTRVGTADEIARGNSTFMVEMNETANILNNATDRSLVILDEVGRGTSTFDGVSIAWSITEFIAGKLKARTLFATHYHQLTELAAKLPQVLNCNIAVKEYGDEVVFLHKIVEGGTDRSYGIHVARIAGIPSPVIARAQELLQGLEAKGLAIDRRVKSNAEATLEAGAEGTPAITKNPPVQLSLFETEVHPAIEKLRELDTDRLTPIDALLLLRELQEQAR
ncbi:MAG: DNA mismatch repair protein MutS [Planctomycetota bacterium]